MAVRVEWFADFAELGNALSFENVIELVGEGLERTAVGNVSVLAGV